MILMVLIPSLENGAIINEFMQHNNYLECISYVHVHILWNIFIVNRDWWITATYQILPSLERQSEFYRRRWDCNILVYLNQYPMPIDVHVPCDTMPLEGILHSQRNTVTWFSLLDMHTDGRLLNYCDVGLYVKHLHSGNPNDASKIPLITEITYIRTWTSNHIHTDLWDVITSPSPNFNGGFRPFGTYLARNKNHASPSHSHFYPSFWSYITPRWQ